MNPTELSAALLGVLIFASAISIVNAIETETVAQGRTDSLSWKIDAPGQVEINQTFTVTFTFESTITIVVATLTMKLSTPNEILWTQTETNFQMIQSLPETTTATISVNEATQLKGYFVIDYRDQTQNQHYASAIFTATETTPKTEPQNQEASFDLVSSLMYLFLGTTIISVSIATYLAMHRKKP